MILRVLRVENGPRSLLFPLLLVTLLSIGCNPFQPPLREITAPEVLQQSAGAMSQLRSVHFRLEVVNGTMGIGQGMVVTSAEGDTVAPDRLQLLVKARLGNAPVEMQIVTLGSKQYLTNPLTHQWQDVSGSLAVPALLDSSRGIGPVLRQVSQPQRLGREAVDGADSYHLRGTVPVDALGTLVGSQVAAGEPVAVDLWIGSADFLLRQARLVGAIVSGESPLLERSLKLSDFDKPAEIKAPTP